MSIHIGTSGWHYRHWAERFYPGGLNSAAWLGYYAREFGCVEINNSFYQLPSPEKLAQWRAQTPDGFLFALKASRYITHMKKLRDCAQPLAALLGVARCLSDRLAAVLFQLPPRWRVNVERLAGFLDLLPDDLQCAFEFRDPSWHVEGVYALLREHAVGLCQFDLAGLQSPPVVTAGLVYVRLHGPREAYSGRYTDTALKTWAERLRGWDAQGHDVLVFFDNDQDACAVHDARRLQHWVDA